MAIIEKKYLLNDSIDTLLKKHTLSKKSISQFYTQIKICKEVRYRNIDSAYYKHVRTGNEIRENVVDKKISQKKYLQAKEKKIGKVLKKERYSLVKTYKNFSVDRYKKQLKHLNILEIRFKTREESNAIFELPSVVSSPLRLIFVGSFQCSS